MELIAAIDLLDGRADRLAQGDFERRLSRGQDAVALSRRFTRAGIRRLHVVDLDGARAGKPVHTELVNLIATEARSAEPPVRVEVGGGLRDWVAVEMTLAAGADEVILGTAALADLSFLARCAERWPGRVGAALDLRDGRPSVDGWTRDLEETDIIEIGRSLLVAGASRLVVTDVSRDGMASGPNLALMSTFHAALPGVTLVAAGGIATADHLRALVRLGVDGAVVGRALLDSSLPVEEALAACRDEVPA